MLQNLWRRIRRARVFLTGFLCSMAAFAGIGAACYYNDSEIAWLIPIAVLFAVIVGSIFFPTTYPNRIVRNIILTVTLLGSFLLLEGYTHSPFTMMIGPILLNILAVALIFLTLMGLIGRSDIAWPVGILILGLIGIGNYYTILFRDNPILPWDLLSIKIAMTVTNNYEFEVTYKELLLTEILLIMVEMTCRTDWKLVGKKLRIGAAAIGIGGLLILNALMHVNAVTDRVLTFSNLFTQIYTYRDNGFLISFMNNLKYLNIDVPDHYSVENVQEIVEEKAQNYVQKETEVKPNILIIMDEAFSDLQILNQFNATYDAMPFVRSLMRDPNTVSGNLYVSVCGGNTANSEFEVLTGDSMAFLPKGSVAYQQYVKTPTPSLASVLSAQGYQTIALHPYNAAGWNRNLVYPYFGFDKFYSLRDFRAPKKLRKYVSDASVFDRMIYEYQTKGDAPIFEFAVTMQNHGGYSEVYDDAPLTVRLYSGKIGSRVVSAENYLSLVRRTDEALEDLIGYFEKQTQPTVIVFFGDHQPSDWVASAILSSTQDMGSEEIQQLRYQVPFVIWANYDIGGEKYEGLSANYLSAVLMEKTGLEASEFQKYLYELSREIPVINTNGYIAADGTKGAPGDGTVYDELLEDYQKVVYNHLFDRKDRAEELFTAGPLTEN